MAKLSDLSKSLHFKALIYGMSGVGKTCSLSKAKGPIYVFDFDNKVSSLATYLKTQSPEKLTQIDYDPYIIDVGLKAQPIDRFRMKLTEIESMFAAGKAPYGTVVLDSLTTFSDSLLTHIVNTQPGTKRAFEGIPALQDYLILGVQFKQFIGRLLALPCDVIIMAHLSMDKDESTGMIQGRPLLSGKLADSLPVVFPEIYRAYVESKEGKMAYALQTRPDGRHLTRTQLSKIPAVVLNDLEAIRTFL